MAAQKRQTPQTPETREGGKWGMTAYLGIVLFIVGFAGIWHANKDLSGRSDWIWYVSAVVAVVGALCWFMSGMSREEAIAWLRSGLVAVGIALVIRWCFAEPYRIPSGSMEPTLHGDPGIGKGDRVFVNKWIYGLRYPFMNKRIYYGQKPERWDIVVFKTVEEKALHGTLVKRIVGLPGERIHIQDGKVFVNGEPLEIPDFLPEGQQYYDPPGAMYGVLPDDEFLAYSRRKTTSFSETTTATAAMGAILVGCLTSISWGVWPAFGGGPIAGVISRASRKTWWWHTLVAILGLLTVVRLLAGRSWPASRPEGKGIDHYFNQLSRVRDSPSVHPVVAVHMVFPQAGRRGPLSSGSGRCARGFVVAWARGRFAGRRGVYPRGCAACQRRGGGCALGARRVFRGGR